MGRGRRVRVRERAAALGARWLHLLQGGALFTPFFLVAAVFLGLVIPSVRPFGPPVGWQFVTYGLAVPIVALAGLLPAIRTLETSAVRALCGVPAGALATGPAGSWAARRRTAVWFTLHAGVGALVSGTSLAVPPAAFVLIAYPVSPWLREREWSWPWDHAGNALWTAPLAGLALLGGLLAVVHAAGAWLARCAPALLGPTPADRLAAAEDRAAELARRNRIARELHDSVGHALSAATLQASAARRVLETDPGFVREALAAIEGTTREAVAELDSVLGVLREDPEDGSTGDGSPTLATGLAPLLARGRATGTQVELDEDEALGPLGLLPPGASAAAFRIVQEGLSNALRHAPGAPVRARLERQHAPRGEELVVTVENPFTRPVPQTPRSAQGEGGRGLPGVRERAALLGGTARAHVRDGVWQLTARLPLGTGGER